MDGRGGGRAWGVVAASVLAAGLVSAGPTPARGQAPLLPTEPLAAPGSVRSRLGPTPGAGGNPFQVTPGTDPAFLGGRPGPSFTRAPSLVTRPGDAAAVGMLGFRAPARAAVVDPPVYGPLEVPDDAGDEGPADGLSLDDAIPRLLRDNLALRSLAYQIPAGRADLLTAGLRANPVLYADAQLVPYGRYTRDRTGGPNQYDLNVNHPVDYSGKRLARVDSATAVLSVLEAGYQDAARVQTDNLYTAFVDVLAARETVRFAGAAEAGLTRRLAVLRTLYEKSNATSADVGRVEAQLANARVVRDDAGSRLLRTRRNLGSLLNLPAGESDGLRLRGTVRDQGPAPPTVDDLVRVALASRPDLAASRLGVRRAQADVALARANRFGDAYVLYQPYTFQNNTPVGLKSATSWAFGATIPIPVYNRNQGGVARARINVDQSREEVAAAEARVAAEVRNADRAYHRSLDTLRKIETEVLPAARRLRDASFTLFTGGELTFVEFDDAQKDYNAAVRRYRDALVAHRRSMLALNTAVGRRVLP